MRKIHMMIGMAVLAIIISAPLIQADETETTATGAPRKGFFKRLFYRPTMTEAIEQSSSPKDVCRFVEQAVSYRMEDMDRWSDIQTTWASGRGDCEDFAVCVEDLCTRLGFESEIRLYFQRGARQDGHAVVVGHWQGKMWLSSDGDYTEVESEQDVREQVASMLACDEKEMWTSVLKHDDVNRFVKRSFLLATAR